VSCFVGQPLTHGPFDRNRFALHVIDVKLGAGVLPGIELGQIAVKMLGINVLVDANDAALEDAEKPFQRIRMHVAALPFVLGVLKKLLTAADHAVGLPWFATPSTCGKLILSECSQIHTGVRPDALGRAAGFIQTITRPNNPI